MMPVSGLTHIKIGPMVFEVLDVDDIWVDGESLWGHILFDNSTIRIKKSLSNIPKQATLLHEVIHGILELAGHEDAAKSEGIVRALSNSLLQVLRDNPEFTKGLLSDGP